MTERPPSAQLAEKLFDSRNCLLETEEALRHPQPYFRGFLERVRNGQEPSWQLTSVRFVLNQGKLERIGDGPGQRAYLKGRVLTFVNDGSSLSGIQVFISKKSRLNPGKIQLLEEQGFAAIFGPPPDLSLVSFAIAKHEQAFKELIETLTSLQTLKQSPK